MDSDRWHEIERIFKAALSIEDSSERARFLTESCGADAALRDELDELISARARSGRFLEDVIEASTQSLLDARAEALEGLELGSYQLESEIGVGGTSQVFRARRSDDLYEKSVAVKLIRPGGETGELAERFGFERQILARLDHPNIARILDGGTSPEGRPYLVMDLVEGVPLTTYCRDAELSLRERLELFVKVGRAVEYAHENLVVHGDLKPANILVAANGEPRLLDFGISQVVHRVSGSSSTPRALSLGYASPEQARGEALTPASDVYALGVLLYRLLCGHLPQPLPERLDAEAVRVLCEDVPVAPSQTVRASAKERISVELDWIVARALAKSPAERYRSAGRLCDDVDRWLRSQPVEAAPHRRGYVARKFFQRNRLLVSGGLVFFLVVVVGLSAITQLYLDARDAEERAESRYRDLRQLVNAVIFEFHDGIAHLPGSTPAREQLVTRALEYLEGLRAEAESDDELLREIGHAYFRVAEVQGHPAGPNLGDTTGALASFEMALSAFRSLETSTHSPTLRDEAGRQIADTLDKIGEVQHVRGDTDAASRAFAEAFDSRRAALRRDPDCPEWRAGIARSLSRAGLIAAVTGRLAEAVDHYRSAIEIESELLGEQPHDATIERALAVDEMGLGTVLVEHGDMDAGLASFERSIERFRALRQREPENIRYARDLSIDYGRYVGALLRAGRVDDALRYTEESQRINEQIMTADPFNVDARRQFALGFQRHGSILARTGDHEGAIRVYEEAKRATVALRDEDPANQSYPRDLWVLAYRVAIARADQGRVDLALEWAEEALASSLALVAADPRNASYEDFEAQSHELVARFAAELGDHGRAADHYRAARDRYRSLLERDPSNTRLRDRLTRLSEHGETEGKALK